jgi:hypothetical protein
MKRLDSVDVLRTLALIGMVICHYPIFLSSGDLQKEIIIVF